MRTIFFTVAVLGAAPLAGLPAGELKLAPMFSDQAVLQRVKPVPVWGRAEPGETVTVDFAGQKKTATTDAAGRWLVTLDPMPANAEPRELRVASADPHANAKTLKVSGVVVGDVWLSAGGNEVGRRGTDADASPDDRQSPPVRVFQVTPGTAPRPQTDVKGRWTPARNSTLKQLPAQARILGRTLADELHVPLGVVAAPIGYPIESWMSRESLAATPEAAPILAYYAGNAWKMRTVGTYDQRLKAWTEYCQKLPLNPPPKPKPDDVDTLAKQEPSGVWNATIAPLAPLAIRGVVWDHGEDWVSQGRAFQQGQLLPAMITGWRQAFGDPALPFIVVQVRPHRNAVPFGLDGRLAAELRDAQRTAAAAAKAALVVTIDLGADPSPQVVTPRIADAVLAHAYHRPDRDPAGPQLAGVETRGDKVLLRFTNTHGGLVAKGGELKGFAIASSLFRWVWADAKLDGDTVIVSAPTVPRPLGVRYAYEDLPSQGATLCDHAGHPAAPFRTDDHPTVTGKNLDPAAELPRYSPRKDLGVEDPRLPRILIIGDSISGHYHYGVRERLRGKANIIGESSMRDNSWATMGPRFYRSDWAAKGDGLKNFLAERGPFDIVHFNNGIHNFSHAQPGDEKPYAQQLRTVVATIRQSGAVCLFANSTGTIGDNMIPNSPHYLTNCLAFNAAAEAVMRELKVPVTDIHGLIQPRAKELIGSDLIHTTKEADEMMADLIARRLTETLATLPNRR